MNQKYSLRKLLPWGAFSIGSLLIAMLAIWIFNHGFIEITLNTPVNANQLSYKIINQADGSTNEGVFENKQIKKLLKTGNYEIHIGGSENSYVTTSTVGRLFSSQQIDAKTEKEKERNFVGYNPAPCMQYLADRLYSYECGYRLSEASVHIPATSTTPTYTVKNSSSNDVGIQDIISTQIGTVMLTSSLYDPTEGDLLVSPALSLLTDSLDSVNPVQQNQLNPDAEYSLAAYGQGFLVYTDDLKKIFFYDNLNSPPQTIAFPASKSERLRSNVSADGNSIVAFYSDVEVGDGDGPIAEGVKTTDLYVYKNSTISTYKIDQPLLSASPCGKYICTLNYNSQFMVYKISDNRLQPVFKLIDVSEMHSSLNGLYLVNRSGVFVINPEKRIGSYIYSLGSYGYCGLKSSGVGVILCLIDADNNKLALNIDRAARVNFPIDKRVYELQSSPGIEAISAYSNILFITPKTTTDIVASEGVYSESDVGKSRSLLSRLLPTLGLDQTNGFTVINTIDAD